MIRTSRYGALPRSSPRPETRRAARRPNHSPTSPPITVPTGTDLVCWIASANRDEGRWGETADQLDITRADARQHVAFGKGAHVCIGSWLARMELEVVLRTMLERYPRSVVAEQELVWSSNVIRGPEELLVRLGTA